MTAMTPLKQNQCEDVPQHSDHDQNQVSHEFPKRAGHCPETTHDFG